MKKPKKFKPYHKKGAPNVDQHQQQNYVPSNSKRNQSFPNVRASETWKCRKHAMLKPLIT